METPLASLWAVDPESEEATRLTNDPTITLSGFTISDDSRWVGFTGNSAERYERNITEQRINADLYLLEVASGHIERLTDNDEVSEQGPSFSPDGRWIAFAADDMTRYTMKSRRVYIGIGLCFPRCQVCRPTSANGPRKRHRCGLPPVP